MADLQIVRIDKIKWWVTVDTHGGRILIPLCPQHNLRLTAIAPLVMGNHGYINGNYSDATRLKCAEGESHKIEIPRKFSEEKQYVIDKIDAKIFKNVKTLNLDDEAVPIAKEKVYSKDEKFFVTAQLMESKRGIQVVVYAGEKGSKEKTQILISPDEKRLAFDQTDLHPSEVFTKVEVTFLDGTKSIIKKPNS
jgi:hypothetical protein